MKCLEQFLKYLKQFLPQNSPSVQKPQKEIKIEDHEIIVRGILHPIFVTKGKLKENAFLPPPRLERKDVSTLRHNLTDTNFCKQHSKSLVIEGSTYKGFGVLISKSIAEVNHENQCTLKNGEQVTVSIKATPDIEKGLPMHADILYSHSLKEDEPNTIMRKMAKQIVKKAQFLVDPNPQSSTWEGTEITYKLFE